MFVLKFVVLLNVALFGPEIWFHNPVALDWMVEGLINEIVVWFPQIVLDAELGKFEGFANIWTTTTSESEGQPGVSIFHWKLYVPAIKPVRVGLFDVSEEKVAEFGPESCDQLATDNVEETSFENREVVVNPHKDWLIPACAWMPELTVKFNRTESEPQFPLLTFHCKI